MEVAIAPLIIWTGHQLIFRRGDTEAPRPQENLKAEAKKNAAKSVAKKGFYIVVLERKVAGPAKEGKYTESQRSYYARKYM